MVAYWLRHLARVECLVEHAVCGMCNDPNRVIEPQLCRSQQRARATLPTIRNRLLWAQRPCPSMPPVGVYYLLSMLVIVVYHLSQHIIYHGILVIVAYAYRPCRVGIVVDTAGRCGRCEREGALERGRIVGSKLCDSFDKGRRSFFYSSLTL